MRMAGEMRDRKAVGSQDPGRASNTGDPCKKAMQTRLTDYKGVSSKLLDSVLVLTREA